jgi:hypothetical protein
MKSAYTVHVLSCGTRMRQKRAMVVYNGRHPACIALRSYSASAIMVAAA